jgi:hypothetical protein
MRGGSTGAVLVAVVLVLAVVVVSDQNHGSSHVG